MKWKRWTGSTDDKALRQEQASNYWSAIFKPKTIYITSHLGSYHSFSVLYRCLGHVNNYDVIKVHSCFNTCEVITSNTQRIVVVVCVFRYCWVYSYALKTSAPPKNGILQRRPGVILLNGPLFSIRMAEWEKQKQTKLPVPNAPVAAISVWIIGFGAIVSDMMPVNCRKLWSFYCACGSYEFYLSFAW